MIWFICESRHAVHALSILSASCRWACPWCVAMQVALDSGNTASYSCVKELLQKERAPERLLPGRRRSLPSSSLWLVNHQYPVTRAWQSLTKDWTVQRPAAAVCPLFPYNYKLFWLYTQVVYSVYRNKTWSTGRRHQLMLLYHYNHDFWKRQFLLSLWDLFIFVQASIAHEVGETFQDKRLPWPQQRSTQQQTVYVCGLYMTMWFAASVAALIISESRKRMKRQNSLFLEYTQAWETKTTGGNGKEV